METAGRTCMLTVKDTITGEERTEGPYDFVIWASQAAYPLLPEIATNTGEFRGEVIHSMDFTSDKLEETMKSNKKVVVVGGGKSGVDHVIALEKRLYKSYSWVMRRPYLFFRYERIVTPNLTNFTTLIGLLLSAFFPVLGRKYELKIGRLFGL